MDTVNVTNWFDVLVWVIVLLVLFCIIGYLLSKTGTKKHY